MCHEPLKTKSFVPYTGSKIDKFVESSMFFFLGLKSIHFGGDNEIPPRSLCFLSAFDGGVGHSFGGKLRKLAHLLTWLDINNAISDRSAVIFTILDGIAPRSNWFSALRKKGKIEPNFELF